MATIREWLDEAGFDWTTGRIIHHLTDSHSPGRDSATGAVEVASDAPVLDKGFDSGSGGPECPRFIAEDAERLYFPDQYDGATGLVFVWKDIGKYLDWQKHETPYPGG